MQVTAQGNTASLIDQVDNISDQVDEIKEAVVELAESFAENKKGNVTDLLCDVAGDTEKMREVTEAYAKQTGLVVQ